jgi:hypothetical protein
MNDEEWEASKLRKQQFQNLAKRPTDNMTVYRMQGGSGDSLGIHWTTDQNVAHYTGLGGGAGETERTVHRATVDRSQIISQSEWKGGNIRSHHTDSKGNFKTGTSQWGFDTEAEIRLRPGSTVREHAVAPQGTHEYESTGREPTIEHRGMDYVDLAHHAVQGTPEAERLHMKQQALPHVQQSMLDPVESYDNPGHPIGYTPKLGLHGGSVMKQIGAATRDVDRISKAAGLGEDGAFVSSAHEPLLSELRQPEKPQAQPEQPHRHNINQLQFEL